MDNKSDTLENCELGGEGRKRSGFAEVDQAIAENCLTEYRLRKSWRDPLARGLGIVLAIMFACFVAFVIVQDLL